MHINRNIVLLIGLGILSAKSILQAETIAILKNPVLEINRVQNAIIIDGDLTELEWGTGRGHRLFFRNRSRGEYHTA